MNGKVEIYTFNEGKSTEFYGVFYAGTDICIRGGYATRTGAVRYAKSHGYELAEVE